MSAITAKARRKMKKYAVLTREPRCFLGSFDFSWEQRKLGDIGETYTGLSGKTKADFGHGQARFVTYMNVFSNPISNPEMTEPIEIDPKQNEVEVGDVLFTTSSETPEEVGMSSVLLEKRGKTYLNSFCFGFRPSEKIDSYYLAYMLRSESAREKIILLAQGISRYNISKNKVMEIAVSLPSLDEQKLIGQCFRQLDHLITLHQRKCVFLFSFFRACISMNFTASTFSWEQRKLGDIASDMVAGGDIDKDLILAEGQYPVIANALTGDGIVGYYDKEYRVNAPAVTVTGRGDVGHAKARLVNFTPVVRLLSVKSEHDVFFLENAINTLKIVIESTGVPQLTVPQLAKYEVAFPRQLDEEEHIGAFFKQLDHLITLHQRECISFTGSAGRLILTANKKRITSSWEQRKAIDIADYSKGNGYSKGDLTDAGTPIILYGRLYTKYQFAISEVDTFAVPRNGAVYSQGNEVIVPASGETAEDIARASAVEKSGVMLGGDLNILRPFDFIIPLFLALAISNGEPQKELAKKAQGKSVVHIHNTDIQEVTIAYPSRTEQDRIVSVFRQLDNLITLHQRKGKAAVSGCFLNCSSLEKSSAQSRTLELFGQASNQEIKYIIDGLSILGGKLRNFCVKLIILLSYTRINDIAKYHISRNTECVHNIN